ncbi:MAG: hypothetical protein ACKOD3_08270, partial [Phenylobacterium sp.]
FGYVIDGMDTVRRILAQPVRVEVYPLEVITEHDTWPEAHQRERRWLPIPEASTLVDEPGLARLLVSFGKDGI